MLAATETDRVVALDPRTGHVLWSRSVGTPQTGVPAAVGCGNIDPLGVTSTPVVDPTTHTVFVVGAVVDGGRVHHRLVGLDVHSGAVRVSADVDPPLPPGQTPLHLLQRASLALGNGRVYVSYGGHIGDCGHYHGWVVGADTADPRQQVAFQVAPDGEGGAIWQSGGAPALDAAGNLYVSTGNANPDPPQGGPDPKRYTESVVELSPELRPLADYKDTTAGGDEDLSTGNPVLLPDGEVFAVGKTQTAFLLGARPAAALPRARDLRQRPRRRPGLRPRHDRMFVPCRGGGLQVVDLGRAAAGPRLIGADSAPIVVGEPCGRWTRSGTCSQPSTPAAAGPCRPSPSATTYPCSPHRVLGPACCSSGRRGVSPLSAEDRHARGKVGSTTRFHVAFTTAANEAYQARTAVIRPSQPPNFVIPVLAEYAPMARNRKVSVRSRNTARTAPTRGSPRWSCRR